MLICNGYINFHNFKDEGSIWAGVTNAVFQTYNFVSFTYPKAVTQPYFAQPVTRYWPIQKACNKTSKAQMKLTETATEGV